MGQRKKLREGEGMPMSRWDLRAQRRMQEIAALGGASAWTGEGPARYVPSRGAEPRRRSDAEVLDELTETVIFEMSFWDRLIYSVSETIN